MEILCKIWTLYVDLVDLLVSQSIFVHHEKPLSGFLSSSMIKVILDGFTFLHDVLHHLALGIQMIRTPHDDDEDPNDDDGGMDHHPNGHHPTPMMTTTTAMTPTPGIDDGLSISTCISYTMYCFT